MSSLASGIIVPITASMEAIVMALKMASLSFMGTEVYTMTISSQLLELYMKHYGM